jgi:hypothetical protein
VDCRSSASRAVEHEVQRPFALPYALFDSAKTMPPATPGALSDETHASIVAYVLQMNGYAAGETPLTTGNGTTLR